MVYLSGHINTTQDSGGNITKTYGVGSGTTIVLLGLVMIVVVVYLPYYLNDTYYQPIAPQSRVVLVRANTPVVQGILVKDFDSKAGVSASTTKDATPAKHLGTATRPDLSYLLSGEAAPTRLRY